MKQIAKKKPFFFLTRFTKIAYLNPSRKRLPKDLQDNVLEAISIQALGQVRNNKGVLFLEACVDNDL